MRTDIAELVKKCDRCKRHANYLNLPTRTLHSITSPWPNGDGHHRPPTNIHPRMQKIHSNGERLIHQMGRGQSIRKIQEQEVWKFLCKQVIRRFGIPRKIITDNGSQFIAQTLKDFCGRMKYSTLRYPKAIGQAEASKKAIVDSLKKKLEGA